MRTKVRVRTIVAALASLLLAGPAHALMPTANASGAALYERECAPCHGVTGHGDGPEAASFVKQPRDLLKDFIDRYPENQLVKRIRHSRMLLLPVAEMAVAQRSEMAETIVAHVQRLPDVAWPTVRHGADVYAEHCESCHGPYGRPAVLPGAVPGASAVPPPPDFAKGLDDAALLRVAQGGHGAEPGFVAVRDDADAKALVAYARLLSPGFARYALWCAPCHGDAGRGDGVYATDIDKPNVVLDRAYLKKQSPGELRRKIMHIVTEDAPVLPHFERDLTPGQARALVAALRASRDAAPAATPVTTPAAGPLRAAAGAPTPAGTGATQASPGIPPQASPAPTPVATPSSRPPATPRAKATPHAKKHAATPRHGKATPRKKHRPAATPHPRKTPHARKPTARP